MSRDGKGAVRETLVDADGSAVEVVLLAAAENHPGALLGKSLGDRGAQSTAGAGDDGYPAAEIEIGHSLLAYFG